MRTVAALAALLLVFIVLPFVFFADDLEPLAARAIARDAPRWIIGPVLAALLASDVVLPIPSSVIGTASGALLGPTAGTLVSWIGMTGGCLAGYGLGRVATRGLVGRLIGRDHETLERLLARHGVWLVVVFRAVPVLAEGTTVVAGAGRMPIAWFFVAASFANLGIAAIYAALGTAVEGAVSFVLAFAAALAVPAAAWLVASRLTRR